MWAGLSAIRLYLQGIRACGPNAAQERWAEFTPVKWGNAEAMGVVILAIWPVAKSAIEARPCTDSAGKCLPRIKLSGRAGGQISRTGANTGDGGNAHLRANHGLAAKQCCADSDK